MADLLQIAGAQGSPTDFAPLHINRMMTGFWTNTNPLRDAASTLYEEKFYGGRQDRIAAGLNTEISSRLTLRRRAGTSVYNSQLFPAVNRFYGWNTFTLTSEAVRVMVDCGMGAGAVYDGTGPNTKTLIHTKAANAGTTYFLGLGNTLYMTNGAENLQLDNATGNVTNWGITAPTIAPTVTQATRINPYPNWQGNVFYGWPMVLGSENYALTVVIDPASNYLFMTEGGGVTADSGPPNWNLTYGTGTVDGTINWTSKGPSAWSANYGYSTNAHSVVAVSINGILYTFLAVSGEGNSGSQPPYWPTSGTTQDGAITWQNIGVTAQWASPTTPPSPNQPFIGPTRTIPATSIVVDPNGYLQQIAQPGITYTSQPSSWQTELGALTTDGMAVWVNVGPFAVAATAPTQYGYDYERTSNTDLSNMSPASAPITVTEGNQVTITGPGSADPNVDTINLYRTAQGGSTFFLLASFPNPGTGKTWTYTDTNPTSTVLNATLQAQRLGEGTPLPVGATCLEYHVGRIFAAVNNVVYVSAGPDAIVAGSSGNAGFNITFTAQSKITRFWVNSLGVVVFTVRDAYIILGSGTDADPLYMVRYIENIPLLHYDAFAIFLTTPYLYSGHRMVNALDPSAGIIEASFPIADQIQQIDPTQAFVTFHNGPTGETALYVSDGSLQWFRMAPTSAPESGLNWNPPAILANRCSAVQSVEVLPGTMALLIGPYIGSNPNSPNTGPILQRDPTVNTDNGAPYPAWADVGNIVLAHSGQQAGLAWITLESAGQGTATTLGVLLDEIEPQANPSSANFVLVPRTRQDPPNAPPIQSFYSNRHSLLQGQNPVWCRSLCMHFYWPPEDAANELYTYTIFGQTWNEQRSQ